MGVRREVNAREPALLSERGGERVEVGELRKLVSGALAADIKVALGALGQEGEIVNRSEHANEVPDAVLLVLSYAFSDPCDIPDFLFESA